MNTENPQTKTHAKLEEIEAIFFDLEEALGPLGLDDDDAEAASSSEMDQLEAALAGTEFANEAAESTGALTMLQIADGAGQEEGWFSDTVNAVKDQVLSTAADIVQATTKTAAQQILKRVVPILKGSARFAPCFPAAIAAIAAFKVGKYGTCVKMSWSALNCMRAKM